MNLERFNPASWSAQFTLDLVKHQKDAERFFSEGEALYAKLKKERTALGSLQDAKIADELAAKNLQEAADVLSKANAAAAKKIRDAEVEINARQSALDEREEQLKELESELEQRKIFIQNRVQDFEILCANKTKEFEDQKRNLDKELGVVERRKLKCRRILQLSEQISKITL